MSELLEELIETVKVELGYPEVDVYIPDNSIMRLINKSIRKAAAKACPTFLVSRHVVLGKVDLSDIGVEAVKNVYLPFSSPNTGEFDVFYGYFHHGFGTKSFYDMVAQIGNLAELKKLAFFDYYLDEQTLYLDNYAGEVGIEYIKKNLELNELPSEWLSWVESYATALSKIGEGRIRGKYRVSAAPFETNADELISEGQSEKSELDSRYDMMMGYFNILRG